MPKPMMFALLAVTAIALTEPLHAQAGAGPEQPSGVAPAPGPQQPSVTQADSAEMAVFVAGLRKGMKGGKGSAQARKTRVREIARQHAESRRQQQGPPEQQVPPRQQGQGEPRSQGSGDPPAAPGQQP